MCILKSILIDINTNNHDLFPPLEKTNEKNYIHYEFILLIITQLQFNFVSKKISDYLNIRQNNTGLYLRYHFISY